MIGMVYSIDLVIAAAGLPGSLFWGFIIIMILDCSHVVTPAAMG